MSATHCHLRVDLAASPHTAFPLTATKLIVYLIVLLVEVVVRHLISLVLLVVKIAHGPAVVTLIRKVLILVLLSLRWLLHLLGLLASASLIATCHVLRGTLVVRGLLPVRVTLCASVTSLLLSLFHLEERVSLRVMNYIICGQYRVS